MALSTVVLGVFITVSPQLRVVDTVHHADIQNREPMVIRTHSGALLVNGFPRVPHEPPRAPSLWRSEDGGSTWARARSGDPSVGAVGNSDTDFAVGPDGTLYYVTMGFNRTTGQGTHVAIGTSRDDGITWDWTTLVRSARVDRPWVEVAPDGTVHVIWNDGRGVHHRLSRDGGRSWEMRPTVHERGGSSHLAVGPQGELAVRITPVSASGAQYDDGVDLIAVSMDHGATWSKHPAPPPQVWASMGSQDVPRWVDPLAWDARGHLYYLWSDGSTMWLGRSADRGATWNRQPIATGADLVYFPFLVSGPDGRLAATWFTNEDGGSLAVALVSWPDEADVPTVEHAPPLRYESWAGTGGARQRDSNGEYAPIIFLPNGDLGVVTPLDDEGNLGRGFTWWRVQVR